MIFVMGDICNLGMSKYEGGCNFGVLVLVVFEFSRRDSKLVLGCIGADFAFDYSC